MNQNFCLIYYYVPQDLDDPENPNAYGIPIEQKNVTLGDIKKSFPLEGKYIFRFRYKVQSQTVWMDLNSDDAKLPLWNNRIFLKATRLEWQDSRIGDLTVKSEVAAPAVPKPSSQQQLDNSEEKRHDNLLDF